MEKQQQQGKNIYPQCVKHQKPCYLICMDKNCEDKFVCYDHSCTSQHKKFINVTVFNKMVNNYKNIKDNFAQKTQTMLQDYFDKTTEKIISIVNQYKEQAISKLLQFKAAARLRLSEKQAEVLDCLGKDWHSCSKEFLLKGFQLLEHGDQPLFQGTQLLFFSENLKLKIENMQEQLKNPLSVSFQSLFEVIRCSNNLKQLQISHKQLYQFNRMMISKGISLTKLQLLFDAKQNEYSAAKFHELCNNKGATLTVVRSSNNCLFGGYSPVSFIRRGGYVTLSNSFLFSVDHKEFCSIYQNSGYAVYDGASYGPTWGGGHDLYIADLCNVNASTSFLNHTYRWNRESIAVNTLEKGNSFLIKNYLVFKIND